MEDSQRFSMGPTLRLARPAYPVDAMSVDLAREEIIADAAEIPGVCGVLDKRNRLTRQTWAEPHWLTSDGQRVTVTRYHAEEYADCWVVTADEHRLRIDRLVPAQGD